MKILGWKSGTKNKQSKSLKITHFDFCTVIFKDIYIYINIILYINNINIDIDIYNVYTYNIFINNRNRAQPLNSF